MKNRNSMICRVAAIVACLIGWPLAFAAPTVSLTGQMTTPNVAPASVTLTWTTLNANGCTATSTPANTQWSGAKPVNGSATITGLIATTVFTLSCTQDGDRTATLTWTPPAVNTDGTPLTDLAGFKIYNKAADGSYNLIRTIESPSAITDVEPLGAPGIYTFAVTAFNTAGLEGPRTNDGSKTATADSSATGQPVQVTLPVTPRAPTNLVVQ